MKSGIAEIVHIVPLGQEFDRAVRPFDTAAANRVRIVADAGDTAGYADRVVRYLRRKQISADIVTTDLADMGRLLATIASLIRQEQRQGNRVYVNMSAAGELAAAAATLAGMALDAEVYCVHADRIATDAEREESGISICTTAALSVLPKVDIHLPDETELPVLEQMYQADGNTLSASEIGGVIGPEVIDDEAPLAYKCCNDSIVFQEDRCIDTAYEPADRWERRKVQSRNLMKVSTLMKKMEEKGYVTKSKTGRKMLYRLSERGRYALILAGLAGDAPSELER